MGQPSLRKLAILAAMLTLAPVLGGCLFVINRSGSDTVDVRSVERAEQRRTREARMHPDCRDDRVERNSQNDGCDALTRRDR